MFNVDWVNLSNTHVNMSTVLVILVVFSVLILYLWHKDSHSCVDLKDLICKNGAIDEKKFTRFSAWIVSTWGFIYLILDNKFTEWYFTGYMAIWVSNAIVDKYLNNKLELQKGSKDEQ